MYNDYFLLKRIEEEEGKVSYATAMDSFTYRGEVIEVSLNEYGDKFVRPKVGDKVIFLKGSGEDIGEYKAVKFEDIIKKI